MIKVELDSLKEDLNGLSSAMENFRPYCQDYISNISDSLDDFNSDFISQIIDILNNMKDTKAPDLMKNLEEFYKNLKDIVEGFEETDVAIADSTKSEVDKRGE